MKVIKEGELQKEGKIFKKLKTYRVWLVGQELVYSRNKDNKPNGNIYLTDVLQVCEAPESKYQPAFKIILPNRPPQIWITSSPMELQSWVKALEAVRKSILGSSGENVSKRGKSLNNFDILKKISSTSDGVSNFLVRHKDDEKLYNMRTISKKHISDTGQIEQVLTERSVLMNIESPFIIKSYYSFQTSQKLFLILDYLPGMDLYTYVRQNKLNTSQIRYFAAEILLALESLHKFGLVYRNLSSANIAFDLDGHLKILNLSLVKPNMGPTSTTSTFCGIPEYIAPEIIKEDPYTKDVDWWGFGILLFEMHTGITPFYSSNTSKLYNMITNTEVSFDGYNLSFEVRALILRLLSKDPSKRLGSGPEDAESIKSHQYFDGIIWNDILNKKWNPEYVPQLPEIPDKPTVMEILNDEIPLVSYEENAAIPSSVQYSFQDFTYDEHNRSIQANAK